MAPGLVSEKSGFGVWTARLVFHHAGKILAVLALITIAAVPVALNLKLHANFLDLLPSNSPSIVNLLELRKHVGGTMFVIAVFESPDEDTAREAAGRFSREVASIEGVDYVDNRTSVPAFENRKFLFLTLESVGRIKQHVTDLLGHYRRKANPFFVDLLEEKPPVLDEKDLELEQKVYRIGGFAAREKDTAMRVVLLKPSFTMSEFDKSEKLFGACEALFAKIKADQKHPLSTGITGPYKTRYAEYKTINADISRTGTFTAVLIALVMMAGFRSFRCLLYAYVPLGIGILWTLAFTSMTIGYLNLITAFMVSILLGMGSDYTLHLLVSMDDDLRVKPDLYAALEDTYCELWKPLLLSMLTTAVAFYAMTISGFEGFRHFGIIAGVGVALAFVTVFYGLPSLMVVTERYFPQKRRPYVKTRPVSMPLIYAIITAGILFSVYSGFQFPKTNFDYDFEALQAKGDDTIALAQRIGKHFGIQLNPVAVITPDRKRAGEVTARINAYIAEHGEKTEFDFAASLLSHVPRQQEDKIRVLGEIDALIEARKAMISKLDAGVKKKIEDLRQQLHATPFGFDDLPAGVHRQYEGDRKELSIVFVYPKNSIMDGKVAIRFVNELRSLDLGSDIKIAGEPVIYADILQQLEKDTPVVMWISIATIIGLLFIHFRRLDHVLWVLLPVVLGFLWMEGMVGASGMKYNFMNVAILPSILGVGIDAGIYIFDHYKNKTAENFFVSLQKTSKAVLLSSVTNICAFLGLAVAHHRGIASLGLLGVYGFTACVLAAVYFVPAVIELFEFRTRHLFKREGES